MEERTQVEGQINTYIKSVSIMCIVAAFFCFFCCSCMNSIEIIGLVIVYATFYVAGFFAERDRNIGSYEAIIYEHQNKFSYGKGLLTVALIIYLVNFFSKLFANYVVGEIIIFAVIIQIIAYVILLCYRNRYMCIKNNFVYCSNLFGKENVIRKDTLYKIYYDEKIMTYYIYDRYNIELMHFGKNKVNYDLFLQKISEIIAYNRGENEGYIFVPTIDDLLEKEKPKREEWNN